ncbi:MAG: hypothetical protein CMF39_02425 [Legionellaceae bacterium]|nr:hypothetical protein [Legionellaceae bacterium]|tara:strand:- start:615 stop:1223 length:609 start_codon:yes stop_codon:yes gene_type:complete
MPGYQFFTNDSGGPLVGALRAAQEYCSGGVPDSQDCLASWRVAKLAADAAGWAMAYIPGYFSTNFSATTDPLCQSSTGVVMGSPTSAGILNYNASAVTGSQLEAFELSLCGDGRSGDHNIPLIIASILSAAIWCCVLLGNHHKERREHDAQEVASGSSDHGSESSGGIELDWVMVDADPNDGETTEQATERTPLMSPGARAN